MAIHNGMDLGDGIKIGNRVHAPLVDVDLVNMNGEATYPREVRTRKKKEPFVQVALTDAGSTVVQTWKGKKLLKEEPVSR